MTELIEMLNKPLPPSAALDPILFIGAIAAITGWYLIIRYSKKPEDKTNSKS